jgi:hypothetical protein
VPVQPDAVGVSQIVPLVDRTPETVRRLLKALMQARLVERKVGRAPLFYRMPDVVFSEAALNGAAPQTKTIVGGWYRDKYGNPTRWVTAADDPEANPAAVHGQAGGLAAARSRKRRGSKYDRMDRVRHPVADGIAVGYETSG